MLDQIPACPCGTPTPYDACCGRLHRGVEQASSALLLMRSRYAAYAVGEADYVWRTWHPRTRPDQIVLEDDLTWTGLTVHGSGEDWVDFTATYRSATGVGDLHEVSRFQVRARRWFYLDGDVR